MQAITATHIQVKYNEAASDICILLRGVSPTRNRQADFELNVTEITAVSKGINMGKIVAILVTFPSFTLAMNKFVHPNNSVLDRACGVYRD